MKKSFIFGVIGLFLALPMATLAIGQITSPIIIDNSLRGGEFQETMIIINNDNDDVVVRLSADGQTKNWTKFYLPSDLENPIEKFPLEKDGQADIVAVFSVPIDTANGDYTGFIGAGKEMGAQNEDRDESTVSVEQKINREVSIKVTDNEVVSLLVSVIPETYDVKKGKNITVRFIYDNQSNIALKPQIQFRIKNSEKVFYDAIFPYPNEESAVRSRARYEIPALNIPTTDLANGKYIAEIDFLHNGESITSQSFKFNVVSGSVLGAFDINLSSYWVSVVIAIALAAILVSISFIIRHIIQKRKYS